MSASNTRDDEPMPAADMHFERLRDELAPLVGASEVAQAELSHFRLRYKQQSEEAPLPPRELDQIRKATRRYLDMQEALGRVTRRALQLDRGRQLGSAATSSARRSDETSFALAAAVLLYDNYLAMLPLLDDKRYRRMVNHADLGYGIQKNELWNVVRKLNDDHSRRELRRLVQRWDALDKRAMTQPRAQAYRDIIESSATYFLARDGELDKRLPSAAQIRRERILDGLAQLGNDALYLVSEGFGNAIGMVELRKGKLWQREDVLGHLHKVLKPLDLLLEKTPFRLTDYLIPGHFGHAAIWMGRPRRVKRLGVWKHEGMQTPRLQHCRPLIEEGRGVLEALRSGVELNPLRVFANVDDLAVLRPTRMRRREILESLVRGFHQVGKEYDFGFDVETTDTIVCSELPYHVYSSVRWQTEEQLGRFTISPDDVARAAVGPKPDFGLMAFYHDGALVPPKDAKAKMTYLMDNA